MIVASSVESVGRGLWDEASSAGRSRIFSLKNRSLRREYSMMREEDKYSVLSEVMQFKSVECVDAFNTIKR